MQWLYLVEHFVLNSGDKNEHVITRFCIYNKVPTTDMCLIMGTQTGNSPDLVHSLLQEMI
jgi:hypothetical protein